MAVKGLISTRQKSHKHNNNRVLCLLVCQARDAVVGSRTLHINQPTYPPTHPFRQGWTINRPTRCTHLFIQTLVEVVDVEEVGPPVGLAAVEVVVALSFPVGAIGHVGQ